MRNLFYLVMFIKQKLIRILFRTRC